MENCQKFQTLNSIKKDPRGSGMGVDFRQLVKKQVELNSKDITHPLWKLPPPFLLLFSSPPPPSPPSMLTEGEWVCRHLPVLQGLPDLCILG